MSRHRKPPPACGSLPGGSGVGDNDGAFGTGPAGEYVDLTGRGAPARGRGSAILNPGNRFENVRLHVLGEFLDQERREHPSGVQLRTQILPDRSRSIINRVADSPDIPFDWTINPYRGCEHGCIYCYARPGHEFLGMSCGLDFESKIMAKTDAPAMLRRELASPRWHGAPIVMSGVTDAYQPIEAKLRITRGCLEVMAACRQPVSIITKNHLVTRDIDLLATLAEKRAVRVAISLTTLDPRLAAMMEPRASSPPDRLRAIRALREAGVPVMVMTAPMIPGLNDHELPTLLEAAADAGAQKAGWVMLRLPYQIKALFLEWLYRCVPEKAARIEHRLREVRGGELNDARFGARMRGEGVHARSIADVFRIYAKRHRLDRPLSKMTSEHFRRPALDGQMDLFDSENASPS